MKPELQVHPNLEDLSAAVARLFVQLARQRIVQTGQFSVALSGGSTPRRLYELLGSEDFSRQIEWPKVHLFQVDERCVPPEHSASNFRMIRESLLERVEIPDRNVHRVDGELPPAEAAQKYEEDLRKFFSVQPPEFPRFDLLYLGMGADGHTASLFPGSKNLNELARWAVPSEPGPEGLDRVTLTVPVLNNAAHIIFLVTGSEKSETLARVLAPLGIDSPLPAQLVAPSDGLVHWHCDEAAASQLKSSRKR